MQTPKFIKNAINYFSELKSLREQNKKYKDLIWQIILLVDDEFITSLELRHRLEDLLADFEHKDFEGTHGNKIV
jgi:hypothetical protein